MEHVMNQRRWEVKRIQRKSEKVGKISALIENSGNKLWSQDFFVKTKNVSLLEEDSDLGCWRKVYMYVFAPENNKIDGLEWN